MKTTLAAAVLMIIMDMATPGWAKEMNATEILAEPTKFAGSMVTLKGAFIYSEPMRESFTIDQNGNQVEVFYRDLAKSDRDALLLLTKYSKVPVTVTGVVQFYTNSKSGCFMTATSVQIPGSPASASAKNITATAVASLADLPKYSGKRVTVKGAFLYSEPMRDSFTIDQNGMAIEVFFKDIPKNERDVILSQKKYSREPVTVTGVVQHYTNSTKGCFMLATAVRLN
jgi:hypothetical protein